MKREAMVLNDPLVIVGKLQYVNTHTSIPKNELWRIERHEEPESPSKVDPEVFSVGELISSDDSTVR